jgi:hypothetical protein
MVFENLKQSAVQDVTEAHAQNSLVSAMNIVMDQDAIMNGWRLS